MNYLFFDIECANCFGGIGKMCSFGYALTDENFNIIESSDIVMNPECEFDWYLYKNKNDIKLAYSQDYFRSKPNFPTYYGKIRELVLKSDTKVFGFNSLNDIGFVVSACERYKLPSLFFSAFDLERIIKSEDEIFGSLEKRCQILQIDNSDLQAHKSSDDAIMTMRLLKAFCEKQNITVDSLMEKNQHNICSTKQFLKKREEKLKKKEVNSHRAEKRRLKQAEENKKSSYKSKSYYPKTGKALSRRKNDSRTITFED